ncbi:MAG: hypothetical protein DME09_19035 [Candidatus Rokuibacteriota bacterium]|nr:MAG: hypothetical protein DME09_19035 [Candidatus Rokubacteria bacterium]
MKVAGLQALFQKLPSWKGITWIFYVLAHREEFSQELKRRDERAQWVEGSMRQLMDLQQETHEAEKRKLERERMEEREKLFALAQRGVDTAHQVLALFEKLRVQSDAMEKNLLAAVRGLVIMLYAEQKGEVRNAMLELMPAGVQKALDLTFQQFRAIESRSSLAVALGSLTPPPLAGDTKAPHKDGR